MGRGSRVQGVRPHGGEVVRTRIMWSYPLSQSPNPIGRCPACLRRALSWFPGRKEVFNRFVVIMRRLVNVWGHSGEIEATVEKKRERERMSEAEELRIEIYHFMDRSESSLSSRDTHTWGSVLVSWSSRDVFINCRLLRYSWFVSICIWYSVFCTRCWINRSMESDVQWWRGVHRNGAGLGFELTGLRHQVSVM